MKRDGKNMGNALIGAIFISTLMSFSIETKKMMCQCPERGNLHFYVRHSEENWGENCCVNALIGATFISTYTQLVEKGVDNVVGQCPERGNLHFYRANATSNPGTNNVSMP